MNFAYGIKAAARPTNDLASLPRSLWGKASTDIAGWGLSARAQVNGLDVANTDLEVDANNREADLSFRAIASAGEGFNLRFIEASKSFDSNGARVTVNPRFNLDDDRRDVIVYYNKDNTNVKLEASPDKKSVTVTQQIDANNRISPSISSTGNLSLQWERRISDTSSLLAVLQPNESLDVEWRDAAWTAYVNMPLDGTNLRGVNVRIKAVVTESLSSLIPPAATKKKAGGVRPVLPGSKRPVV